MLTAAEKVRIRYHMGYPNLSASPTVSGGLPSTQLNFRLEDSMRLILPDAEPLVRELIVRCDQIDSEITEVRIRMQAAKVDNIELRQDEPDALEREYMRQVARLSDTLQCTVNPFCARFRSMQTLGQTKQIGMIGRN